MRREFNKMPLYEYCCNECNKDFEIEKSITKYQRQENCPICNKLSNRVYKNIKITFNWVGNWYANKKQY